MKKFIKFTSISLILLTANSCRLLAPVDRSKYSDLEGRVYSIDSNTSIPNASVSIKNQLINEKTNGEGNFFIRAIPVDWHKVNVSAEGYQVLTREVQIEPNGVKYISFGLIKNSMEIDNKNNIVFERNGDIWISDEYGVNQLNITQRLNQNEYDSSPRISFSYNSPVWFSDKNKIGYIVRDNSVNPNTRNGLWEMSPQGKFNQRITYIDSYAYGLSISSIGNLFMFSMINPDNAGSIGLYKFNKNTNKLETLSAFTSRDTTPDISPDSKMITFTSGITERALMNNYDTTQYSSSRSQVFVMDTNGYKRKQLTQSGENTDPSWSPDGEKIAFISNRSGSSELWLMNKDGSGQRSLTSTGALRASNPVWSKDGQRIIFNSNHNQKYYSLKATELWMYEPATYTLRMITNDAINPDW